MAFSWETKLVTAREAAVCENNPAELPPPWLGYAQKSRGCCRPGGILCTGLPAAELWSLSVLPMNEVTRILSALEQGELHAAEHLLPLVYEELRKLAAQRLAQEKPSQTLQPTALVHEAYLRLVDTD